MKAIILAAGKQTRIGFSADVRPKSLIPVRTNDTIILNIIRQLDIVEISEIRVYMGTNDKIEHYIKTIEHTIKTPITLRKETLEDTSQYVLEYKDTEPVLFIFGDIYVPAPQLTEFVKYSDTKKHEFAACLALSKEKVGDLRADIFGSRITEMSTIKGDYYTCGLFAIMDTEKIGYLVSDNALPKVFEQMLKNGVKIANYITYGFIDVDYPEKISLLPM